MTGKANSFRGVLQVPYNITLSKPENRLQTSSRPLQSKRTATKHTSPVHSNRVPKCEAFGSVYYRDLVRLQQRHSNVVGLSCCGRKTIDGSNVRIGLNNNGITKSGLFYCKSFLCVSCSKRRVAEQTEQVAKVLDKLNTAFFITLTIKQLKDWGGHKEELLKCWNSFRGRLGRFCKKVGIEEPVYFRTIDFTISPYEQNPTLHTHLHIALGWRESIGNIAEEFRVWVRDNWIEVCLNRGVYSSIKGQDIQLIKKGKASSGAVGFYLSKPVISKLGAELTSLHKDGSGIGKTSMGLGRLMCEIVDSRSEDRDRLIKVYSSVVSFMKGTKFQVKNNQWRKIEEELEEEELEATDNNEVVREVEIGNHNFFILSKEFGSALINYCEQTLMLGGERFRQLKNIVEPQLMIDLGYECSGKEELEQTLIELFREHLHKHSVDWKEVDRRKVSFIRR